MPHFVQRTLLALGALVVGMLGIEIGLRQLPPERLGFEFSDGVFRGPREFREDTTANSWGFHDREHGFKPAGVRRVLLLGDSYVAALSMPLESTVGRRLETVLRQRTGEAVEVVSMGRPGWGQDDELRVLERFGPQIAADVVVTLVLTFNDLSDNSPELDATATAQLERIAHVRPGWTHVPAAQAPLLLFPSSVLNQLISHRLALLAARHGGGEIPLDYMVYAVPAEPAWLAARDRTEELLTALRDQASALRAKFAVVTASTPHGARGRQGEEELFRSYPAMRQRRWDFGQPDRWIGDYCARQAIPHRALEPVFREQTAAGATLHWAFDGHWNAAGNQLAAEQIADVVEPLLR